MGGARHGDTISGAEVATNFRDPKIGGELVPTRIHVTVFITKQESGAGIGTVTNTGGIAESRTPFQFNVHRNVIVSQIAQPRRYVHVRSAEHTSELQSRGH